MNALHKAHTAYSAVNMAPARNPRATEYAAFAQVTGQLRAAETGGFADLAAAIHQNRRLWTVLAADLGTDGNALPRELRAQLLSLAQFCTTHGSKVLRGEADIAPLIEVNTAVMRGLDGAGGAR